MAFETDFFIPTPVHRPAPTPLAAALPPEPKIRPDSQQIEAINHDGGPACVDAAAGSGKSFTMTYRVRRLLLAGVSGTSIVVTTFTRKGAEAIVSKLKEYCGDLASKVTVGTFHRIAAQEMIAQSPDRERWHVLDEDDASNFWDQACAETAAEMLPAVFGLELFTGNKHPNKELERRIKGLFNALREIRSFQVNMNQGDAPFAPFAHVRLLDRSGPYRAIQLYPCKPDLKPFFTEVLRRYEGLKRLHTARDYDDLLVAWKDLLQNDEEYRLEIRHRWQHVIVDEYQDTNYLQEEVIKSLNTSQLMVVGDVAQCIYSWRSAVPRLMIEFCERYSAKSMVLEFNYRSRSEILDVANGVLRLHHKFLTRSQPSVHKPPARLLQLRQTRGAGGKVDFVAGTDRHHETELVAARIDALLRAGELPKSIVVLTRAAYYTGPLEARLRAMTFKKELIKVQVWGGRSLLASRTAKDLIALMHCIARPGDQWPYLRLATLCPGVGEVAAANGFFRRLFCLSPPIALQGIAGVIADLAAAMGRRDRAAPAKMREFVEIGCDFLERLYKSDKKADEAELRSRQSDLDALRIGVLGAINDMARRAEETNQPFALADLINTFTLDPNKDPKDPEALTISTVHSAKGLEWKHVFVVGVNEGTLPILRKRDKDHAPSPAEIAQIQADIEEECRILYVALTRAMDTLTVSFSAENQPSRFLTSVPELKARCDQALLAAGIQSDEGQWRGGYARN